MANPPLSQFQLEEKSGRWVKPVPEGDFDVAVPDDGGKPMELALALLDRALPERESLVAKALEYITAFCSPESNGLSTPSTLVELSVAAIREELGVYVFLNFEGDTYGLWSVGFIHSQSKHWAPSSFRRESW
jgi:hypothetical protein